jgi:hypothetical protein
MADERWGEGAADLAGGLRAVLDKVCGADVVRRAEEAVDGCDATVDDAVASFGIWDFPPDPELLAVAAWELGRALAPVPFVETTTVRAVLGLESTSYGLEGPVPARVPHTVVAAGGGLAIAAVSEPGRRSTAGDILADAPLAGEPFAWGSDEVDRMRRMVRLLAAARSVGAAEGLLAIGVAYAARREQFGRPIGSFQAVAHRLVDAAIVVDGAGLLVRKAAWVAGPGNGGDGAPSAIFAAMVWAKATAAALATASAVHQSMGGYGFALEEDCQLYSRRIRSWHLRLDRPGGDMIALARTLLDPETRAGVEHLWHADRGVPVPAWARELDASPY